MNRIKMSDFMNQQIPADVLAQLEIVGRVKHFLKPTTTSAISTPEDQPGDGEQRQVEKNINDIIDEVKELEDLIEQLEDLADHHLKDMSIPPQNDIVAEACKQLGSDTITLPIVEKALTIMDYLPMMTFGQDPFLSALTGDGSIDGPRLNCSDIDPKIGNQIRLSKKDPYTAEQTIKDMGVKQAADQKKKLKDMMIDFINQLFFKKLWPFIVDLAIINPARIIAAKPIDGITGFFRHIRGKWEKEKKWRKKTDPWLVENGYVNKAITWLRQLLLCRIPKLSTGSDQYYPELEGLKCDGKPSNCPDTKPGEDDVTSDKPKDYMAGVMDSVAGEICISDNELMGKSQPKMSTSFGVSTECVDAAKTVLEATLADAFTPPTFKE